MKPDSLFYNTSKKSKFFKRVYLYYNIYIRNIKFLFKSSQFNEDLKILKKHKVNFVFTPSTKEIFKERRIKKIVLPNNQKILCAKFRKGHFEGVLDIMDRFIKLINPKYTFMGEKDFQQLFLVNKFISKKYKNKIYPCRTVRDKNFLALSSRNFLLSKNEFNKAGQITKYLFKLKLSFKKKNQSHKNILVKKKELQSLHCTQSVKKHKELISIKSDSKEKNQDESETPKENEAEVYKEIWVINHYHVEDREFTGSLNLAILKDMEIISENTTIQEVLSYYCVQEVPEDGLKKFKVGKNCISLSILVRMSSQTKVQFSLFIQKSF